MLFYEDLVRKIEEKKIENIKKIEKFGLNGTKSLGGYGIGIPLILIGLFEIYSYTVYHKWYLLLIGIIFLGIGLKQLKTVLTYSYVIDTETKNLKFGKLNLQFDNVQTGTLKEMKLGKRVTPVIDMITNDKKQIVIPLFMAKQERFVLLLKEILADRFSIKK
ncbi:hypothetical protein CI111_08285 [Fusobacterium animalis]|uniref:YokE-like PH domain-containing protein n=1 Tax=Fusobacterium animalis TaxID=76859 RepID=A0A2G9F7M0_9FUSO|nr:hypothetical protein [Fusobacterium animalis]PIM89167.1 hypothetical protein CI114_09495 [Fusobacterium animalis]PIM91010.1 hypothetical protein CI111_08285 [Fusobacterium animalis]